MKATTASSASGRRRGGAALVALVCLSIIALAVAGLLRLTATRAEQIRAQGRRAQADWLVQAGLERAAARLRIDPGYGGETWAIPPEALGGRAGAVAIAVDESAGAPGDGGDPSGVRTVRVRADYPADGDPSRRARRSGVFRVRPAAGTRIGGDAGTEGGES